MSSLASDSSKGSKDPSPSPKKLDPASLGEHTKRAQGHHPPDISKKLFVNSWVASQTTDESESEGDESSGTAIPMIVLTDADEESKADTSADTPLTNQEQEPKKKTVQRRGSLDVQPGSGHPRRQSPRRPTTIIDQPILEEPEDGVTKDLEDNEAPVEDNLKMFRSAAVKLTTPTTTSIDPQASSSRQRARSYPATSDQVAQPMLELPHRVTLEQQKPETSSTTGDPAGPTKLTKFTQMAIMAKKWKKRSDSTDATAESCEQSIGARQKKRPYIEVPRALKLEVFEDAHPIVLRTYQLYKSYLGPKHKLSELAEQHLDRLNAQLGKKDN